MLFFRMVWTFSPVIGMFDFLCKNFGCLEIFVERHVPIAAIRIGLQVARLHQLIKQHANIPDRNS